MLECIAASAEALRFRSFRYGKRHPFAKAPHPTPPHATSPHLTPLAVVTVGGSRPPHTHIFRRPLAYGMPEANLTREVLADESLIPFHVAIDISYGEQAALADIILPDATALERWDAHSTNSYGLRPYTGIRQPLVPPAGEARPAQIIWRDLARRIGGGMEDYFDFEDLEEAETARDVHLRRIKEIVVPPGRFIFPLAEGSIRQTCPGTRRAKRAPARLWRKAGRKSSEQEPAAEEDNETSGNEQQQNDSPANETDGLLQA